MDYRQVVESIGHWLHRTKPAMVDEEEFVVKFVVIGWPLIRGHLAKLQACRVDTVLREICQLSESLS